MSLICHNYTLPYLLYRLLEINGEEVSSLTHKDVLNVLEGQSNVQIVVSREMQEVKEAVNESRDIEQLKEECSRYVLFNVTNYSSVIIAHFSC